MPRCRSQSAKAVRRRRMDAAHRPRGGRGQLPVFQLPRPGVRFRGQRHHFLDTLQTCSGPT